MFGVSLVFFIVNMACKLLFSVSRVSWCCNYSSFHVTDGVVFMQEMYMTGLPEHRSFINMYDVACIPFHSAMDGVVSNGGEHIVGSRMQVIPFSKVHKLVAIRNLSRGGHDRSF